MFQITFVSSPNFQVFSDFFLYFVMRSWLFYFTNKKIQIDWKVFINNLTLPSPITLCLRPPSFLPLDGSDQNYTGLIKSTLIQDYSAESHCCHYVVKWTFENDITEIRSEFWDKGSSFCSGLWVGQEKCKEIVVGLGRISVESFFGIFGLVFFPYWFGIRGTRPHQGLLN